ncbi:glutathione S-transferase [Ramaria rubella]|nr:glutathione S-transferase [Ramaria rubella]
MTITLYSHKGGPNGWKVVSVLEELGIKYETKFLDFQKKEQKDPEYTKYNPNGRIPAIVDHDNNDFVLWESSAIISYLVDRYDKDRKISYDYGTPEFYQVQQWLAFQISGQGPYFGQAFWFKHTHPEKVPSAIERYQKEVDRVLSVLDSVLAKQPYLVGDHATIADLSFISWNNAIPALLGDNKDLDASKYTNFQRWHDDISSRPAVKKTAADKAAA